MSINSVTLSGNITRDPELRQTVGGTSVLSLGLAVNERRRDASGNWDDYANFVDCVLYGKRAESLSDILRKGAKVAISGRLHYSAWTAKDGSKRSKLEVVIDDIDLMQRRGDGAQQAAAAPQAAGYAAPAPSAYGQTQRPPQAVSAPLPGMQQAQAMDIYDEDIPF